MMGVGVTSLLLILGVFCSASSADQSLLAVRQCMRRATECFAPVQAAFEGMSGPEIINQIATTDLSQTCGHVTGVRDCVRDIVIECQLHELDDPRLQDVLLSLRVLSESIDYICVNHIDVFNEHKACLLRLSGGPFQAPQIIMDVEAQCEVPTGGPNRRFCIPASFPDCASGVVEQQCGAEIANAVRGLGQQIAGTIGTCGGRRHFKLMKKKEMYSPQELMHKAFPSLF